MNLQNDLSKDLDVPQLEIHIKIKKRTGRTHLTSIEGLDKLEKPEGMKLEMFLKKFERLLKKKFICGAFIEDNVIILNGDHRQNVKEYLVSQKYATEQQIKVHGF